MRPALGVAPRRSLKLNDTSACTRTCAPLRTCTTTGKLAIIQGVGYPNPNRSHFRSMDIWHTARPDANADQGWLGAFMSEVYKVGESPFQCVNIGTQHPQGAACAERAGRCGPGRQHVPVPGRPAGSPTGKDPLLKTFGQIYAKPGRKLPTMDLVAQGWDATVRGVEALGQSSEKYQPSIPYPQNPFAKALQNVAQMIAANLGTRVFYVSLGGFDTHSNQKPAHANLLDPGLGRAGGVPARI